MRMRHLLVPVLTAILLLSLALPPAPAAAAVLSEALPSRWVGFYVPGCPLDVTSLSALEGKVGASAAVVNYFQDISGGFTAVQARRAADHGAIPLVTLEFWNGANGVNQPAYSLKKISGGSLDTYLRTFARSAKAFGRTIWLRPFHEMNGTWYPWCGTVNGNTPADFVPAWRHMKDIFVAEGATNVKFVWCPNADSVPNTAANAISKYWPGESYVDLIGIDGYNFGGSTSKWRSFTSVFSGAYSAVTALSATKPVFIAETACGTVGGDKAVWVADMYRVLPSRFPRISGVTWFNTLKECDWRVESSAASLAAYKVGLSAWRVAQAPVPATGTATSLTALTSVTSVRLGNTAVLSGAATPFGTVGTNMVVYVMKPGKTYWSYSSRRTIFSLRGAAAWWYRYLFVSGLPRGTYRFKGCYPGSTGLLASSSSQVVSIALR